MAVSEVGAALAAIKASTGLTWDRLAVVVGASSGDYVRKVAAGKRPGLNLAGNLNELQQKGFVSKAVPRARSKSGDIRPVRASAKATGRKSARPAENILKAPASERRIFAGPNGKMGYVVSTGDPSTPEGAARFRRTLGNVRAARRIKFNLMIPADNHKGYEWVMLGGKGGYRPEAVRAGVRKLKGDIVEWFMQQADVNGKVSSVGRLNGEIWDVQFHVL
jgi:hypothetical protein